MPAHPIPRSVAALALLLLPLAGTAQPAAPLVAAAGQGDLAAVRRLAEAGTPIEQRDERGRTPLLAATDGNHVEVARYLIARGADVNAQDRQQDSAHLLAGARGYTEILRATLAAGADFTVRNRFGGNALIPACERGHVDTVQLLLTTRIPVDHVNNLGWTCLLEAVILGDGGERHQRIVRMVVAHGANVNLADRDGVTPLQHALRKGQAEVARILRAAGAR
jgi:ankyrin repeat protein